MFIKMKHYITDVVLVLNIDVESYIEFYVNRNVLIFSTANFVPQLDEKGEKLVDDDGKPVMIREKDAISFKTEDEATFARDSIFSNLGNKAPGSKILDLTVYGQMMEDSENDGFKYVDFKDVAEKFKVDVTKLRLVDVSNQSKSDGVVDDEIIIEEIEDVIEE